MTVGSFQNAQIVILAGGLGTRMREHFPELPKAMMPIHGKPFLQWQLELLRTQGLSRVLIITGFLSQKIEDFISSQSTHAMQIEVLHEGERRLGTGGALRMALDQGRLAPHLMLLYGDSYLPVSYLSVWEAYFRFQKKLLMTVFRNENRLEKGNVEFDPVSQQVVLYDKFQQIKRAEELHWVDYGLSVFDREVLARIPRAQSADLSSLYHDMSLQNEICGWPVTERFYEVGSPQGLRDFEGYLHLKFGKGD